MKEIKIKILEREWGFKCIPEGQDKLLEAALILDAKMKEIYKKEQAVGYERILLMAALTTSHELLEEQRKNRHSQNSIKEVKEKIVHLRDHLAKELRG